MYAHNLIYIFITTLFKTDVNIYTVQSYSFHMTTGIQYAFCDGK